MALDWTSFARDGHDTLMLSMLTEHGRATGVMWETVSTATLKDNRNRYEDELLYRFSKVVPEGVAVTVVADRRGSPTVTCSNIWRKTWDSAM